MAGPGTLCSSSRCDQVTRSKGIGAVRPLTLVFADVREAVSSQVYKQLLARWEAAGLAPQERADRSCGGHLMRQLMMDAPRTPPNIEVSGEDLAAVLFTSFDVAVMDADGYFQIISRKRDTIMAGDYSVYPRDVEEVLYEMSVHRPARTTDYLKM